MDAADFEIIQLLGVATEIEVLQIIGAAVMPSIIGLLLAFVAFWLPDDDSQQQQFEDRPSEPHRANDDKRDWRRAA